MQGTVILVGAVRGLASEGERVAALFRQIKPDILGLSVPKEGLAAMREAGMAASGARAANDEEKAYIRGLSAFGDIVKPPPCFLEPLGLANSDDIPVMALDMDDEHFTAAYCKYVGTLDMIRQGRRGKAFSRYAFRSKTPEGLAVEWDRLVNRLAGYRALEGARERWLAKGIARLAEAHARPFIVVEVERVEGVSRNLKALGVEFQQVH